MAREELTTEPTGEMAGLGDVMEVVPAPRQTPADAARVPAVRDAPEDDEVGYTTSCCFPCVQAPPSNPSKVATYAGDTRTTADVGLDYEQVQLVNPPRTGRNIVAAAVFHVLFLAGIAVGIYGFAKGETDNLVYGRDYHGVPCGTGPKPKEWDLSLYAYANTRAFTYQSLEWSENIYTWYPVPYDMFGELNASDPTALAAFDADTARRHGVCVAVCPGSIEEVNITTVNATTTLTNATGGGDAAGAYVIGTEVTPAPSALWENEFAIRFGLLDNRPAFEPGEEMGAVWTYGNATPPAASGNTSNRVDVSPYYKVWYKSYPVMRRCLPRAGEFEGFGVSGSNDSSSSSSSGADEDVVEGLADATLLSHAMYRAVAEMAASETTLRFGCVVGGLMSFTFLILAPVLPKTCVCIALGGSWVGVGAVGALALRRGLRLHEDETASPYRGDASAYFAAAGFAFVLAIGLAGLGVAGLRRRLRYHICAYLHEAVRVVKVDPTIIFMPVLVGTAYLLLTSFFYNAAVHIYALESPTPFVKADRLADTLTHEGTALAIFLAIVWMIFTQVTLAVVYFTAATLAVQHYFSHVHDGNKGALPCVAWLRGLYWGLRYHVGSFWLGSIVSTIVPMVRGVLYITLFAAGAGGMPCGRVQTHGDAVYDPDETPRWMRRTLHLAEKHLSWPSRMALIMIALESTDYATACSTAVDCMRGTYAVAGMYTTLVDAFFFAAKMLVASLSVCWAYWMQSSESFSTGIDNGLALLVIVGIVSYAIASMFCYCLEAILDTAALLICYEARKPTDPEEYFCHATTFKVVTGLKKYGRGAEELHSRMTALRHRLGLVVHEDTSEEPMSVEVCYRRTSNDTVFSSPRENAGLLATAGRPSAAGAKDSAAGDIRDSAGAGGAAAEAAGPHLEATA